jgi:processive 1,2-diacylglycerol beta-glucosyltransferase
MTKNKKILLISVSAGSGHVRAAQAIEKTAKEKFPELHVGHIDMMDYTSKSIKKTIVESYDILAKQLPELYGLFYKKTDKHKMSKHIRKLAKFFNRMNAGRFFEYIKKFQPDHILCTHFLPVHALSAAQKKYNITAPISLLMTDYQSHDLQLSPNVSHYFVSTEKMRWRLACRGIDKKNVIISGIPIDPVFYKDKSLVDLKEKYHIQPAEKNILVLSGGHGLANINKIMAVLFKLKENLNIFAIAGNNAKLKQQLEEMEAPKNINLGIIGWTDKIDEYMRLADIIITKTGGLTTTECIVLQKPIIAISPIPGQEEYNAEYILENNFGVIARTPDDLLYYLKNNLPHLPQKISPPENQKTSAEVILEKISE